MAIAILCGLGLIGTVALVHRGQIPDTRIAEDVITRSIGALLSLW